MEAGVGLELVGTSASPKAQPPLHPTRERGAAPLLLTTGDGTTCSQSVQESQERVWRTVAARLAVQRLGAGECSFFDREVGVEVHLRGFDLLVSESQRDHGGVDAGLQEPHRGGVAQDVRRDRLGGQGRAAFGGVGGVLCDPAGERFAGQRLAGAGRKQRLGGRATAFGQPRAEDCRGFLGQWGDASTSPRPNAS